MKVTIEIECTPEEARAALGLPDLKPLQENMMADVEARLKAALSATDPETFLKTWLPANIRGLEDLQKIFWSQMSSGTARATGKTKGQTTGKTAHQTTGKPKGSD